MDGLRDLAGWVAPAALVALVLSIPWAMGWLALVLS